MITQEQQIAIKKVLTKSNPTLVGLFGSYGRGEQRMEVILTYRWISMTSSTLELIGLEQELSEVLWNNG